MMINGRKRAEEPAHLRNRPGLMGWSAVEEYMRGHDDNMVKDYADDVDTLLVFAGLFSAVLTAFVVLSYSLLQVDNSQTTVDLLSSISNKLGTFHINPPRVLNSTAPSPTMPEPFRTSASAIWINSLWFVSLVVSLASAFFGILVKQWLREYMKWNAALGDPKENVLVRQLRYEAWKNWNVDAVIGAIPGLLELAVILFLAGLVVLLWTVNVVVAAVVTVTVTIFLAAVIFFLTAPVFFKRCPYKSPTARAFVVAFHIINTLLQHVLQVLVTFSHRRLWRKTSPDGLLSRGLFAWRRPHTPSWKDIELASSSLQQLKNNDGQLSNASATYTRDLQPHARGDTNPEHALLEMGRADTLLRALLWVAQASQDERVVANVALSAESLHSPALSYDIRYLSTVHLLSTSIGNRSTVSHSSRRSTDGSEWLPRMPEYALPRLDGTMCTLLQVLRLCYHVPETNRARRVGGHLAATPDQGFGFVDRAWYSQSHWYCTRLHFDILLRLLVGDIKSTVIELVRLAKSRPPSTEPIAIGCRIMGLLSALHRVLRAGQRKWPDLQFYRYETAFGSLIEAYNALSTDPQADCMDEDWCPGLRTAIIATICTFVDVQFSSDGKLELAPDDTSNASTSQSLTLANLIITYENYTRGRPYRREDCSCIVAISTAFIRCMVWQNIMPENDWRTFNSKTVRGVVAKMLTVAQTSLERSYSNCGSYKRLPWLSTFTLRNFWLIAPDQLAQLLDIFEKLSETGLLTDEVKVQLARARSMVAYFEKEPDTWQYNGVVDLSIDPDELGDLPERAPPLASSHWQQSLNITTSTP